MERKSSPVLVRAHLGELHPLPAEHRAVLAREQRADQPAGAELDALDLLEDFGGDGHGWESGSHALTAPSPRRAPWSPLVARHVLRLGLEREHDPVAQDVGRERANVLGDHVGAAAEEGVRPGRLGQRDRGAGRAAEGDQGLEVRQPDAAGSRVARTRSTM